jgi:hypothetical protein
MSENCKQNFTFAAVSEWDMSKWVGEWIGEQASKHVGDWASVCVEVWVSEWVCMFEGVQVCTVLISQRYLYGLVLTLSCWAHSTVTFNSYCLTDNDYGLYFLSAHSAYLSN